MSCSTDIASTVNKISNQLSSFISETPEINVISTNIEGSEGEKCNYKTQPLNLKCFRSRVTTFYPGMWTVRYLSPLTCARYGWILAEKEVLQCVTCCAVVCTKLPSPSDPQAYEHFLETLGDKLISGHVDGCGWQLNPSPTYFCHPTNITCRDHLNNLSNHAHSLAAIGHKLPYIDTRKICRDWNILPEDLMTVFGSKEELSDVQITAALFCLSGWTCPKESYLQCNLCQRSIGLWSYNSCQDNNEKTNEHNGIEVSKSSTKNDANKVQEESTLATSKESNSIEINNDKSSSKENNHSNSTTIQDNKICDVITETMEECESTKDKTKDTNENEKNDNLEKDFEASTSNDSNVTNTSNGQNSPTNDSTKCLVYIGDKDSSRPIDNVSSSSESNNSSSMNLNQKITESVQNEAQSSATSTDENKELIVNMTNPDLDDIEKKNGEKSDQILTLESTEETDETDGDSSKKISNKRSNPDEEDDIEDDLDNNEQKTDNKRICIEQESDSKTSSKILSIPSGLGLIKNGKRSFDPLDEHRHWCGWISERSLSPDLNDIYYEDLRGFRVLISQIKAYLRPSEKEITNNMKSKNTTKSLRAVRSLLNEWTGSEQEVYDENTLLG